MRNTPFLPTIFDASREFDGEKLALLVPRSIASFCLAGGCTLLTLALLYINDIINNLMVLLALAVFIPAIYPLPILAVHRHLSAAKPYHTHKQIIDRFFYYLLGIVVVWDLIGLAILPLLPDNIRLIIICLYIGTVYAHFLPLSLFPKYALIIGAVNLFPLSLYLALLGDPTIMPLGLAGLILIAKEPLVIAWTHAADLNRIQWRQNNKLPTEPDMSQEGFKQQQTTSVFNNGFHSIVLQVAMGFFIVIALREDSHEQLLWSWFLLHISLHTLRAASHVLQLSAPDYFTTNQWRGIAFANVFISQASWLAFMATFYFQEQFISSETAITLQTGIAVITFIGLGADRLLMYSNTLYCLALPFIIGLNTFSPWMVIALVVLVILTVIIGLENLHGMTLRSLESQRLRKLAEFRAAQMETLNTEMRTMNADLSQAREHLTEANASLEAQVKERTRELQYQAEHDMLTGLGNRYRFTHVVEEALRRYKENNTEFAVYLLDLNRFKEINDGLGHFAGDRVLQETAHRLRASCVPNQICARWGGDEFVILQQPLLSRDAIHQFAGQLLERLCKPIELESGPVLIGASIGVSMCPDHGMTAQQLLEHADIAVYRAKCSEQNLAVYQSQWGTEAAARLQMAQSLRTTISNDKLEVALQPFISAIDGRVTGFEALARWPQIDGRTTSPAEFIPIAEESGLMPALGKCILRKACHTLQRIAPDSPLRIAVNISVSQLLDPGFYQEVKDVLAETGLPANRLELEVTENLFANGIESIRAVLAALRALEIRIAIDDFGTGYSSISYLRDLPIDTLKIDRSFVTALNSGGEAIYSSIVSLANSLKLHTIVEGIETDIELAKVKALGGNELQGFYFAKPMHSEALAQWLKKHNEAFKPEHNQNIEATDKYR